MQEILYFEVNEKLKKNKKKRTMGNLHNSLKCRI